MSKKHVWDGVLGLLKAAAGAPVSLADLQTKTSNPNQLPLYIFHIRQAGYDVQTHRTGKKATGYSLAVKGLDDASPVTEPVVPDPVAGDGGAVAEVSSGESSDAGDDTMANYDIFNDDTVIIEDVLAGAA